GRGSPRGPPAAGTPGGADHDLPAARGRALRSVPQLGGGGAARGDAPDTGGAARLTFAQVRRTHSAGTTGAWPVEYVQYRPGFAVPACRADVCACFPSRHGTRPVPR